ncbi:MAG: tetratricopeptide repeat protein, partial [Phycisphaerae bacterium]
TDDAAATPEAAGATPNVGNLVVEPGAAVETAAVENPEPASPAQPAEPVQQAGAILRECIADHAEGYEAYVQLASLLLQTGSFAQAVDVCEERLQLGLSRKGVRALRNRLKTFTLMILASQACLSEAAGARQAGDETGYERWMKRADQYVEDARGEFPSHPRLFHQLGRIKLARGLDRAALDDFRTADEAYRSNDTIDWNNKLTLARVHLQLKEAGAARAVLEEVQEEARSFPGNAVYWLLYAKALLLSNEADRALVIADQLLQANPTSPDVRRLKAAILERQGRSQEAGELIEAVSGDRVARAMLTARARALSGDDAAAMTILREALVRDPDDARLVSATARELFRLDRPDEAREVVTAALAAAPDDVSLQTLSVLARADLSPEARDSAILEIITAEPDAYQRALELIHFHGSRNDNDKVLAAVQRALHHLDAGDTPSARLATIGHRRALLRIQLQVGAVLDREDVMAAARDQAQRYDVDGAGGKSLLGYYHMLRREFDLAARALRLAIEAQPTDAGSLTLLGQCLQETGDPEDADAYYVRAIEVNANEALAHRGRAVLARLRGDDETFERSFEMCRQLLPGDPWVQAEISHRREQADPHAAIARREALLEKDPEDVTNLKRLASLSETVGDTDAADEYCRRLLVLRPDDPALVLAVSRYYRRTDRPHMALTFLTTYADALPSPKEKANAHVLLA